MASGRGDMDFSSIESVMYGNVDDDDELNAELMALMEEEQRPVRAPARKQPAAATRQPVDFTQIDRLAKQISLEDAISDDGDDNDDTVENDVDLLDELGDLIGEEPSAPVARPAAAAAASSSVAQKDPKLISMLQERAQTYRAAEANAIKSSDSTKARRFGRGVKTLEDLLKKAERGVAIDPDEVPVALSVAETSGPPKVAPALPAPAPAPARAAPAPPQPAPRATPAAVPATKVEPKAAPTPTEQMKPAAAPKPAEQTKPAGAPLTISRVRDTLVRRRDEYKKNAALAMHVKDKGAAMEFIKTAKQFDAAIAAVDSGEAGDDLDMSVVPPSPDPYKGPSSTFEQTNEPKISAEKPQQPPMGIPPPPKTFLEGLEQRLAKYRDAVERAKGEGNERKQRQNDRIVKQYEDAIKTHKAGRPVDVAELPAPPGYPPLPPATGRPSAVSPAAAIGGAAASQVKQRQHPAGPYGPVVASHDGGGPSPPKQSRNSQQLDFLENRQLQFKQAALLAKRKGDMDLAKKYLRAAKGFDSMIDASRAGLPVNIKDAPIPPQARTAPQSLQPAIAADSSSPVSITGTREEVFATLEKDLIRQVQICDRNREYFTRLGDVGQVNKYETQASALKKDLVTLRQAAKGGDPLPRFRYETKAFPSLDICPDLGDDDLELTIVRGLQVKLPAGYEDQHADIFVRYEFPFPQETPQTGKTKNITGTSSPVFNEKMKLAINRKSRQLTRLTKRHGCKFEVFQRVGMFRSDKLLGTCESKLLPLETKSEIHESLDLMDGKKTVGGKLEIRMRMREPLVDKKATVVREKWLVIDEFARRPQPPMERTARSSGALPILSTRVARGDGQGQSEGRQMRPAGGSHAGSRSQERVSTNFAAGQPAGLRRASGEVQQPPKGLRRHYEL